MNKRLSNIFGLFLLVLFLFPQISKHLDGVLHLHYHPVQHLSQQYTFVDYHEHCPIQEFDIFIYNLSNKDIVFSTIHQLSGILPVLATSNTKQTPNQSVQLRAPPSFCFASEA